MKAVVIPLVSGLVRLLVTGVGIHIEKDVNVLKEGVVMKVGVLGNILGQLYVVYIAFRVIPVTSIVHH